MDHLPMHFFFVILINLPSRAHILIAGHPTTTHQNYTYQSSLNLWERTSAIHILDHNSVEMIKKINKAFQRSANFQLSFFFFAQVRQHFTKYKKELYCKKKKKTRRQQLTNYTIYNKAGFFSLSWS